MSLLARLFGRRSRGRPPQSAEEGDLALAETSKLEKLPTTPEGSGEYFPDYDVGEMPTQRLRPIIRRGGKPHDRS